jgi:uncharacterized protein (TIGR00369 family)
MEKISHMADESSETLAKLTSNYQRHIGFRLAEWRFGRAVVLLDIREEHLNRSGTLHGGVLATLIDAAGSFAGNYVDPPDMPSPSITLSLTTNFLGSAASGLVRAVGRRVGGGARTFFANIEVTADGAVVVTGSAVYRLGSIKP